MLSDGTCGMSFWRDAEFLPEPDFDVSSAVPARAESPRATVNFPSLLSYWKTHGSLLNPLLKTATGEIINLQKECVSSNSQVAALSGAMLKLQDSVIQQFHLYRLSSGRLSPAHEEPVKCIDSWILREGGGRGGRGNRDAGQTSKAEQALPLRQNKNALKRRSSVADIGSYPGTDGEITESPCDHREGAECSRKKRTLPLPKVSPILEGLLDHVRQKVSKAKWSKDLHEFSSDQMLPTAEFEVVREDLDRRRMELSPRCIKYLACAAERPCWAIMEAEFATALGGEIGTRLSSASLAAAGITDIQIHTIYICYDYDKELFSVKAVCSPTDISDPPRAVEDETSISALDDYTSS